MAARRKDYQEKTLTPDTDIGKESEHMRENVKPQDIFNVKRGLENSANDEELFADILQMYLEDASEGEAQLGVRLENGDFKGYEILVHALKNNLRTIGAENAADIAQELEMHCKAGSDAMVRERHTALLESAEAARGCIRRYLSERG